MWPNSEVKSPGANCFWALSQQASVRDVLFQHVDPSVCIPCGQTFSSLTPTQNLQVHALRRALLPTKTLATNTDLEEMTAVRAIVQYAQEKVANMLPADSPFLKEVEERVAQLKEKGLTGSAKVIFFLIA